MAARALFVGLGGTGGVSLAFTRAQLAARLRAAGWKGGFPDHAWRFLHIDVPANSDIGSRLSAAEAGDALALGASSFKGNEYRNLVEPNERYIDLDERALARNDISALAGWRRRDPLKVTVPIEKGAGQYRAVGALVALSRRERIVSHLEEAHRDLSTQISVEEAQKVTALLGGEPEIASDYPHVFIVTSMVGGAGAGLYIEVASNARALFGQWVSSFMVAPEGFNLSLIGNSAPANAWGLVSELQYLLAAGDADHDYEVASKRLPNPGAATDSAMATARGIFVLGRSNQRVRLDGEAAVEKVIGEALASSVTSDAALVNLINFGLTNRTPEAQEDSLGIGTSCGFRSMGFGRLELGRARFSRYMSDRLTGLVGQRLASLDLPRNISEDGNKERLLDAVSRVADSLRYTAAGEAGLRELDTSSGKYDQILDALRPAPSPQWQARYAMQAVGEGNVQIDACRERMKQWARDLVRRDRSQWTQALDDNIQTWRTTVQAGLIRSVTDVIGNYGLPVAAATLDRISDDLRGASDQLRRDSSTRKSLKIDAMFGEVVPASYTGVVTDDQRSLLSKTVSDFIMQLFEGQTLEAAADACEEVSANLVNPLRRIVASEADRVEDSRGEWQHQLEVLPIDGNPAAYEPRPYEVVIEDIADFDKRFGEQISSAVEIPEAGTATNEAVHQILADQVGRWLHVEASWQPGKIGDISGVSTPIHCKVELSPHNVMDLVSDWIRRPEYPLREYLQEGLGAFVEDNPTALEEFRDALSRLVMVAGPLSKTNNLVSRVHGEPTNHWAFTEFPFSGDDEAERMVEVVLSGATEAQFGQIQMVPGDRDSIELLTEEGPYHALCFETIMGPIRSMWAAAIMGKEGGQRGNGNDAFGKIGLQRQAMPLSMSGPLSGTGLRQLTMGYLIELARGNLNDGSVVDPKTGLPQPFPTMNYPILDADFRNYKSQLGEVIDNMKVAYLQASQDGLKSLRPYQILLETGSSDLVALVQKLDDTQREKLGNICDKIASDVARAVKPNSGLKEASTDIYELQHVLEQAVATMRQAIESAKQFSETETW